MEAGPFPQRLRCLIVTTASLSVPSVTWILAGMNTVRLQYRDDGHLFGGFTVRVVAIARILNR